LSNAPDLKKSNAEYQLYPFADANITAQDNPIIVDSGEAWPPGRSLTLSFQTKEYARI
jgi:hypothetical protein